MERGPGALTHRIQQIFFGFIAVTFVLIVVSTFPALSSRGRISNLRERWLPARAASFRLSTSFVDQETGERGFVITRDSKFLQTYRSGSVNSQRLFRQLGHLLQSDSVGTARLTATQQQYRLWKHRSAEPEIAAARGPTPDLARSIIASGAGRLQFGALRAAAGRFIAYTDDRATDAQRSIADANDFLLLSLASAVIAVAVLAAIVRRWLKQWSIRINEHLTTENRLATQTALLESITNQTPDPIFLKDAAGRYVFMNPAGAAVMGGRPVDAYLGRTAHDLLPAEAADVIRRDDLEVIRGGSKHSYEEQIGGSIYLSSKSPYDFIDGTRGVLGIAREISDRKRQETQLATIAAVTRATAAQATVAEVALAAGGPLRAATNADLIWIFIADRSGRHLDTVLNDGSLASTANEWASVPVDGTTGPATAFRADTLRVISVADVPQDSPSRAALDRERLETTMHLPFPSSSKTRGVLTLAWRSDYAESARRDSEFFSNLVAAVAESLARAQAHELQQQAVAAFQRALLPDEVFPTDIEIAVRYEPALDELDVGGDWYDVFELGENRLGIVVGDVVGNGVHAAAVMGQLKSALKAIATIVDDPAEVLLRLDHYAGYEPGAVATTVCYGVLDRTTRVMRYCCAGHPAPALVEADGTARFLEDGRSFPIGASPAESPWPRTSGEVVLAIDAVLVLYTDGLIERRKRTLDAGMDELQAAVVANRALPIEEMADNLLDGLDPSNRRDDTALMCVRLPGRPSPHLTRRIPADIRLLRGLRADIRAWLRAQGLESAVIDDVLLATFEAVTNAVEHGYQGDIRQFVVIELSLRDELHVTVRDRGRWATQVRRPERGRGQAIMRSVMDDVTIDTQRHGTVVRMRRAVRDPHPRP